MDEGFWVFLIKCFYLMLPAYFADMAPVIVKKINFLKYPVDFGFVLSKKPLFGKNKTFRGFFFAILFSIVIAFLQQSVYTFDFFRNTSFYSYENWILFGFLMGLGALTGDLIKSFFKRRIGIKPGEKFVPFDQTDFVIGSLIFIIPIYIVTFPIFLTCLVLSLFLHILVNHIAFFLKIRNEKW